MGCRRFHEQKWLLDHVIATTGLDWDQLRMAVTVSPSGFEGMGDWAVAAKKVARFDDITPAFADGAARRETRARAAADRGEIITARESFLIAAIYYGLAQWPIDAASDRNRELGARKISCFAEYAGRAHHAVERVEIPMGDHKLPGWLHLPRASKPPYPVVIMMPGVDTYKEQLVWAYGDKILEREMAALAIEGPGQYEARLRGLTLTADNFADAGRACLAWIDSRSDLDSERIGVFGRSFGSYAGTVMASAISDRLSGMATGLVCHEPGFATLLDEASPTFKNRLMFMAGYEDETAFDRFMQSFDLRAKAEALRCPSLIVAGEMDQLSPIANTYDLTRRIAGPVELVIYQNELHAIGKASSAQLGPHWYSLMADWLAARIRDKRPQTSRRFVYVTATGQTEERAMP